MTKLKYDMTEVEDTGGEFTLIPADVYDANIDALEMRTSAAGNEMIAVTYKLRGGEFNGRLLWDNVLTEHEASAWKYLAFLKAVGVVTSNGKKRKGEFTLESFLNKPVRVRVKHEPDNREESKRSDGTFPVRSRVGGVLPALDDEDEDVPGEDEDEKGDVKDDDAPEDVWTWADIEDEDLDGLKEIIDDEELDVTVRKNSDVDRVRARVATELGVEEPGEDEDDDGDSYEDMDVADLKAECKERELSSAGSKKTLIKKLRKDDEGDGGEPF